MKAIKRRDIIRFDINRIRPYSGKVWRNLSPDQMLQFLEYMALKSHGPNCTNKDYLIRKITNNKCGNKFIRQQTMSTFYLSDPLVLNELRLQDDDFRIYQHCCRQFNVKNFKLFYSFG